MKKSNDCLLKLHENRFIADGICKYTDGKGNSAFLKRTEHGFVAKLRFANPMLSINPVHVSIPLSKNDNGVNIKINFLDGNEKHLTTYINDLINDFGDLLNYWIMMITAINNMGCDNKLLAISLGYEGKDFDEIASKYKLEQLSRFEELADLINSIMQS